MKFKRLIIFWSLFLVTSHVMGQQMPNIVPPSPEAASLFKFTEIPVSHYTGVPNITIPIYEIEARGLTIPINISYHARGNRVDEIASQVGMGWVLNYGGMISRQIRGKADDSGNGYFNHIPSRKGFFSSENIRNSVWMYYNLDYSYDFIPDQYYFNANNLSGKFVFDIFDDTGMKPVIQQYSNIKIERDAIGFIITDGDGNKYFFYDSGNYDKTEEQMIKGRSGTQFLGPIVDTYNNAWNLTKIETSGGETIEFFYEIEYSTFYRRSHDIKNLATLGYDCHYSLITSYQNRLTRIKFDKGVLVFEKALTEREDLNHANALGKIRLFKPGGENETDLIKELNFEYEYTTGPNDNNQLHELKIAETHAQNRMFLKSVQTKFGQSNDTLPRYKFKYNPIPLPNRHSNSQDVWGYYNGKPNGSFLQFENLGVRAVDVSMSSAGILEEITNPQGGKTKFTYEHNMVVNPFPKSLVFLNPNPVVSKDEILTQIVEHATPTSPTNYSGGVYKRPFTISNALVGYGTVNISYVDATGCGSSPINNTPACKFEVKIINAPTNSTATERFHFIGEHNFTLPPGEYILQVKPKFEGFDYTNPDHAFIVKLIWNEEIASPDEVIYAAGKRIQKIEYIDPKDNSGFTKTYSYMDNDQTSGMLFGLPNFYSIKKTIGVFNILEPYGTVPGSPLSTYQGNSVGYGTVTEYQGQGSNVLGKTVYKYSMIPDSGLYYDFPYHPPTDNEWLRGKEESVTHFKKAGDAFLPVKKIKTEYIYADFIDALDGNSSAWMFTPIPIWKPTADDMDYTPLKYRKTDRMFRLPIITFGMQTNELSQEVYSYKTYHFTGGTVDVRFTEVTDYFDDGSQIKTRTDYTYDYDEHYNIASANQNTSDGSTTSTKYFYPGDMEMALHLAPSLLALKTKNMLNMPLVTQTFRNNSLISSTETTYRNWRIGDPLYDPSDLKGALLFPEFIKKSKSVDVIANPSAAMETVVQYNKVDYSTGNPLEIQRTNGMKVSYIWEFNKNYPKVKVENASYEEIAAFLGETETNLRNGAISNTQINQLRTGLQAAMVTSYTYNYLIGVKTITDPQGNRTTFDYDGHNRLKLVRDSNNNILTENEYYYATPTN